jgi:aconitate hydratase
LQFEEGQDADSLGLTGEEVYEITGLAGLIEKFQAGRAVNVRAKAADERETKFRARLRIDTPQEALYYKHGGILQFVLRQLQADRSKPTAVSRGKSGR